MDGIKSRLDLEASLRMGLAGLIGQEQIKTVTSLCDAMEVVQASAPPSWLSNVSVTAWRIL